VCENLEDMAATVDGFGNFQLDVGEGGVLPFITL
jgi:hypothetical protein